MQNTILNFIKKDTVLTIAAIAAAGSCLIEPPSARYLDYIDYRVLVLLFCLMAVVAGMNRANFFAVLSNRLIRRVSDSRAAMLLLIVLAFFMSMFLTNDVTLVTLVPFTILTFQKMASSASQVRDSQKRRVGGGVEGEALAPERALPSRLGRDLLIGLVLITAAANLGSMLTPFGNPQNLYLYSHYHFEIGEFLKLMLPYTALSLVLILILVHVLCRQPQVADLPASRIPEQIQWKSFSLYLGLFIICLASVIHLLDYRILLVITLLAVLIMDRSILKKVDYSLLGTFVFLFIFIGNLGTSQLVRDLLKQALTGHEVLTSVLASQFVSNVPAALLLSGFTDHGADLVIGTNLGGLGTLIASMASLITYKLYAQHYPEAKGRFLLVFSLINVGLLVLLGAAHLAM